MVLVAGHPVGAERDDRVRRDGVDDLDELPHDRVEGRGGAGAVGEAQQVVLGDAERGQRSA
jgi:hypothetical protein